MTSQFHGVNTILFQAILLVAVAFTMSARDACGQRFATGGPYGSPAGRSPSAEMLNEVGISQRLNEQIPLDVQVTDEKGNVIELSELFLGKPVVLALVQYQCPMLCTQVLNGFVKANYSLPLEVGRDFEFIAISFDTRETASIAMEKKRQYAKIIRRLYAFGGMHFLTADQTAIDRITEAVGFRYRFDPRSNQFAHASGIVVVTPDGHLARYFYGIEYSPHDLRLGLVEAARGRIGTSADQVLLLCYHYDPLTGRYGLAISRLIRGAGLATIAILGIYLAVMFRREMKRPKLIRSSKQDDRAVSPDGASLLNGS